VFGDHRYILVTAGEKPTGGYDVSIIELEESEGGLVVWVELTEPEEDEPA